MKQIFDEVAISTKGSGLYDFTNQTKNFANTNKLLNGILNIIFQECLLKIFEKQNSLLNFR